MAPPLEPTGDERQLLQAEEGEVVAGEEENKDAEWCYQWPVFRFDRAPRRLYHFRQQFRAGESPSGNFLKGVKWSPDGSCFLTSSDDDTLRLFYLWVPSHSPDRVRFVRISVLSLLPFSCSLSDQTGGCVHRSCGVYWCWDWWTGYGCTLRTWSMNLPLYSSLELMLLGTSWSRFIRF